MFSFGTTYGTRASPTLVNAIFSVCRRSRSPQLHNIEKSTLQKVQKTPHVGMHSHQKTIPQKPTKQATRHTGRCAQTTHTSQRNAFTAYLPSLHLSNHTSPMMNGGSVICLMCPCESDSQNTALYVQSGLGRYSSAFRLRRV